MSVHRIVESVGKHPFADLEFVDEGERYVRVRIREPHGETSFYASRNDLRWIAERALLLEAELEKRECA